MRVLTSAMVRELERRTVEEYGVAYGTLMEVAGGRVVEAMLTEGIAIVGGRFMIFCGRGNNGGDGAVVARQLWMRGARRVDVFLLGEVEGMKDDARVNMEIVRRLASGQGSEGRIFLTEVKDESGLPACPGLNVMDGMVVIDGIFGTGLSRPVSGLAARVIEEIGAMRAAGARVIAIDLPSGLVADSGGMIGPTVRADLTVTFMNPKPANVVMPAAEANGRLRVAAIGTPDWLVDSLASGTAGRMELVEEWQVARWLAATRRKLASHKGAVGNLLLVAGSRGRTGAAALAAAAALRAGAGTVTLATPQSAIGLLVAQAVPEAMSAPLAETSEGGIAPAALAEALRLAGGRSAIGLGPGILSSEEASRSFVRQFVEERSAPMVIDADGLNALAPWPTELCGDDSRPIVITPHPGEMARLTGMTIAGVQSDRISAARDLACQQHLTVVLKGARTLVATPDGEIFIVPFGNPGMATAGSGDVLTGVLVALLGQAVGIEAVTLAETVVAGVSLHAMAGDLAATTLGERAVMATSIIEALPQAIIAVGGEGEKGRSARLNYGVAIDPIGEA